MDLLSLWKQGWSSLSAAHCWGRKKKLLSNSLEWKWENRENVQRAERDEGVKERGRERREDGRKG